ncbi:MAG: GTPase [Methylococcales bacterium]|nr:GTPase [Methylococcales bacterium]
MSARFFSIMIVIFGILPLAGIVGFCGYFGVCWLWEHHWLYQAASIAAMDIVLVGTLVRYLSEKINTEDTLFPITANANWTNDEESAFKALTAVKQRWGNESDLLTNSKKLLRLTNDVLATVATHFHKDSKYPILSFPLPYLFKLITLVCNDMQREILDKFPASHLVNIGTFLRTKEVADDVLDKKWLWGMKSALFNLPVFLVTRTGSALAMKGAKKYIVPEILQFVVSRYVDILGKYAIQLYSGQITLDDIDPTSILTSASKADKKACAENEKTLEPLRILVLGQVSSGKSSLINALFGEVKSAVSVLPTTSEITPYTLERDGLQQAIILDSAGYGGLTDNVLPDDLKKEWIQIDIILMVCSASNAARSADVAQLKAVRDYFQAQRKQAMPVVIGVATHIDRLRPLQEWQPPYNIENPEHIKAQNIRAFCEAISKDLSLPMTNIVPVCLNPQTEIYNVNEGLIPKIYEQLKGDAQRVRYLRCLRYQQDKSYWEQLGKQALGLGRVFFG